MSAHPDLSELGALRREVIVPGTISRLQVRTRM
jgi:hypothetical protein